MLTWRFEERRDVRAGARPGSRGGRLRGGAPDARRLGRDLAYVGRADEGVGDPGGRSSSPRRVVIPYAAGCRCSLTDVLMMLGRPEQWARVGARPPAVRRYGSTARCCSANSIEALLAIGEWEAADSASAAALRAITANFPDMRLMLRADLRSGAATSRLRVGISTRRSTRCVGTAGWGSTTSPRGAGPVGRRGGRRGPGSARRLTRATSRHAAQLRVWFCAKGLRAQAELVALREPAATRTPSEAGSTAQDAHRRRSGRRGGGRGGHAERRRLARAGRGRDSRGCGLARPQSWSDAAAAWTRLERPPLAAYCRWREAEALVAAGASRTHASAPLREAHAVAVRLGARPLLRETELLAQRARLDLTPPEAATRDGQQGLQQILGLTPREAEVLGLVARGYTDREIAAALVISAKTASVHVSHILRKLEAPNRLEAAAIAHRLAPPRPATRARERRVRGCDHPPSEPAPAGVRVAAIRTRTWRLTSSRGP